MRQADKRFVMAAVLTTIGAIAVYVFLSLLARNYANNIEPSAIGGVVGAPFIIIGVFQDYWWFIYAIAMLMLIMQWAIRRFFG